MAKKCIYCGREVDSNCVIDFCEICGKKVWGEKMFRAIIQNMEQARNNGDLCHMNNPNEPVKIKKEQTEIY